MSESVRKLWSTEQLARHYGRAKKTIQNKLTQGWGPTPVLNPNNGRIIGFDPREVERYDRQNTRTRKQYLYE